MTSPPHQTTTPDERTYRDTLPDCPLITSRGWTGPFEAPSVTTINNARDKGGGLDRWKRRTVAEWAIDNTDTWVELDVHNISLPKWEKTVERYAPLAGWTGRGPRSVYRRALDTYLDDPAGWHRKLCVDLIAEAPNRHSRDKAQQGTDLHKIIEDVAHGRTPVAMFPDDQAHIDQVKEWCDRWQPEFLHAEQPVFSRTHGYAGTPDAFVKLPGIGVVVADWKRQDKPYDDVARQLAPYARADYLIAGDAVYRRAPVPDTVGAVVVNFPPDGTPAQVRPVKPHLLDQAWETFLHTIHVHNDRNTAYLDDPVNAPTVLPGDPDRRAALQARIELYRAFYADTGILLWLSTRWPAGIPTLKQSDQHTADQLAVIERLLDEAEAEHQIPFDPPRANTNHNSTSNEKVSAQ